MRRTKRVLVFLKSLWPSIFLVAAIGVGMTSVAQAVDWNTIPVIQHKDFQAVNANGSSAYASNGFPVRFVGVVLNNNEDWLDPTSRYCTEAGHEWDMGAQAEFYIQAVNLDGTPWDPKPSATFNDFGGTSNWIGQNYGNHVWHYDSEDYDINSQPWNYTQSAWYSELDRLKLYRPGTSLTNSQLIRAGDLVEVRARAGLAYAGKMNVNESHNNSSNFDFEVVVLDKNHGLPTAEKLTLSNLENSQSVFNFDPTRATGGEHYQSTLVTIEDVRLADASKWGTDSDLTLNDATGRTMTVHLGFNDSFTTVAAPMGYFDVTGILDQYSETGGRDGYQLLVMNASDFVAVPEPMSIVLLACGLLAILAYAWRTRK
jgi:hypothetical protein